MTTRAKSVFLMSLICALGAVSAHAEDIDIFSENPITTADAPNILIMMDNTSNWNTQFDYEMLAIKNVVNSLSSRPAVNIGIMEQTPQGADGGYMRFAVR